MNSLDPKNHTDRSLKTVVDEGQDGAWWVKKTARLGEDKRRMVWGLFTSAYAERIGEDTRLKKATKTAARDTAKKKAKAAKKKG
jgi:hypothetical protein